MRILLLGNTGQLGWELERTLAPLGALTACDYPDIDLADLSSLRQRLRDCQPDLVVNATAYTAVDHAETEPELAQAINALAPGVPSTRRWESARLSLERPQRGSITQRDRQESAGQAVSGDRQPGPASAC